MTNSERLRLIAESLYGPLWQNAAARGLGVNPRQITRWTKGEYEPSDSVIAHLIAIARERVDHLNSAIARSEIVEQPNSVAPELGR